MGERVEGYRPLVVLFAIFVALMGLSGALLFVQKLGASPSEVAAFYRGSEAAFTRPRSLEGLLKVLIPHLLAIPLTLFIVFHLVGWAGVVRRRVFVTAAVLTFGLALLGLLSGFGVRFVWPQLALLKIVSVVGFEALLLWWVGLLAIAWWPRRSAVRFLSRAVGREPELLQNSES